MIIIFIQPIDSFIFHILILFLIGKENFKVKIPFDVGTFKCLNFESKFLITVHDTITCS